MKSHSDLFDFDEELCAEILQIFNRDYKKRRKLYKYVHAETHAPQHLYKPKIVSQIDYLYFTILLTYRSLSEKWFEQSSEMEKKFPHLFSEWIVLAKESDIQHALEEVGFIYHITGAHRWKMSGVDLYQAYNGDPAKIFKGVDSISEIVAQKNNLKNGGIFLTGYGPKLLSLLNIIFYEFDIVQRYFDDAFPADIHIQNQCLSTGIIKPKTDLFETTICAEILRKEITRIMKELAINPLSESHAMWFNGNRLCRFCLKRAQSEELCPIFKLCKGRINTKMYHKKGKWYLGTEEKPLLDK